MVHTGKGGTICNKVIAPSHFFRHNRRHNLLGTKSDTTKEHEKNSIGIYSIYRLDRMLFCRISFRFQLRKV